MYDIDLVMPSKQRLSSQKNEFHKKKALQTMTLTSLMKMSENEFTVPKGTIF